jgi:hypothetical protein
MDVALIAATSPVDSAKGGVSETFIAYSIVGARDGAVDDGTAVGSGVVGWLEGDMVGDIDGANDTVGACEMVGDCDTDGA